MAVKTEITACLKHNKIDNKSVACESLSCTGLLTKHQQQWLAWCFPENHLAHMDAQPSCSKERRKQDRGCTLAFLGTGYTVALPDSRGLCPFFLTKNHGQWFFRNRGWICPFQTAAYPLYPVCHSKRAPNNTEVVTAIGTGYLPVVCKIFGGFLRFVFSIYIRGTF